MDFLRRSSKSLFLLCVNVLQDGTSRVGTFEELSKGGVDFESLIKSIEEAKAETCVDDVDVALDDDEESEGLFR